MVDQILISIIIPVYNVAEWIERCLLSVCNQTYSDIECIIVDDCTPDNSMDIVAHVLENYVGPIVFKVITHDKNQGLSAARNSGIINASGDYLYFLDSDDELYSSHDMQLFYSYVNKYGKSDFFVADYEGIGFDFHLPIPLFDKAVGEDIFYSYIRGEWSMIACAKFIKRTFLIKNNLFFEEGLLHEDELFSFRLSFFASSMVVIKEQAYRYYMRAGSIMNSKKYKNFSDILHIISLKHSLLIEKKVTFNKEITSYFISILFGFICSVVDCDVLSKNEKILLLKGTKGELKSWKILDEKILNMKSLIEYCFMFMPLSLQIRLLRIFNMCRKTIVD